MFLRNKKRFYTIGFLTVFLIFLSGTTYANIKCVQSKLNLLGLNAGPVDGVLGKKTKKAAEKFAKDKNSNIVSLAKKNSQQWCVLLEREIGNKDRFDISSRPKNRLSTSDQNSLWIAYQNINQCFDHPTYGEGHSIQISKFTEADFLNQMWKSPFTKVNKKGKKYCLAKDNLYEVKPIQSIQLDETYGQELDELNDARLWFSYMTSKIHRSGKKEDIEDLRRTILKWANTNALSSGINVSWGNQPVDWQVLTTIISIMTAVASVSETLSSDDRLIIGPWLQDLMTKVSSSYWKDRQDNKAYMVAYLTMLWGLMVGYNLSVQNSIDVYKTAIDDMRPDGSMPIDTQRSGMGLKYNSDSVSYLVMMGELLKSATEQNLFKYSVNGRSIDSAVDFMVKALKDPSGTNQIYAIGCAQGGDRWGTVDAPNMYFKKSATYLYLFAVRNSQNPHSGFLKDNYKRSARQISNVFGGAPACLFLSEQ